MNEDKKKSDENDADADDSALHEEEKVSIDWCISLIEELIHGMEQ